MRSNDDNDFVREFISPKQAKFEEKLNLRLARDIAFKRLLDSNEELHAHCAKLDEELHQVKVELYEVKARREFLEAYANDLRKDLERLTAGKEGKNW